MNTFLLFLLWFGVCHPRSPSCLALDSQGEWSGIRKRVISQSEVANVYYTSGVDGNNHTQQSVAKQKTTRKE